jgi:hypothetical protein
VYSYSLEYDSKNFTGYQTNANSCPETLSNYDSNTVEFLKYTESKHKCAGVCYPMYYFAFTDISVGPPTFTCLSAIEYELTNLNGKLG